MKKIKGDLSISRVISNTGERYIEVGITDDSFRYIVRGKMTFVAFTEAITGLGNRPIDLELFVEAHEGK